MATLACFSSSRAFFDAQSADRCVAMEQLCYGTARQDDFFGCFKVSGYDCKGEGK